MREDEDNEIIMRFLSFLRMLRNLRQLCNLGSLTFKLTLNTKSKSLSSIFKMNASRVMPAQLIAKVGGRLYLSMAASRTLLMLSELVTSSSIGR